MQPLRWTDYSSSAPENHVLAERQAQRAEPWSCSICGASETVQRRPGPDGARTLCNRCGRRTPLPLRRRCGLRFAAIERRRRDPEWSRNRIAIANLIEPAPTAAVAPVEFPAPRPPPQPRSAIEAPVTRTRRQPPSCASLLSHWTFGFTWTDHSSPASTGSA